MGQPFALFHQLWLQSKSHEVATCDETRIFLTEKQGRPTDGALLV
jgi:hypothetical protein